MFHQAGFVVASISTTSSTYLYYCLLHHHRHSIRRPYYYRQFYRAVTTAISNPNRLSSIPTSSSSLSSSLSFLSSSTRWWSDSFTSSWKKKHQQQPLKQQHHDHNHHKIRWKSSFHNNNNNNNNDTSQSSSSSSSSSTRNNNISNKEEEKKNNNNNNNFVVSILGPPNAGKSTLFNRLQCKTRNKTYKLGSSRKKKNQRTSHGRVGSRFTSRGNAIVSNIAGTTRDRRQCYGRIGGTEFILMDTAGVDGDRINLLSNSTRSSSKAASNTAHHKKKYAVERAMMEQTLVAAKQSDLILLMWDAKVGITQDLAATARWLRKLGKTTSDSNNNKVAILANKLEGDSWVYDGSPIIENIEEVKRLGLGDVIPISALQGDGMADIAILIEQIKAEKLQQQQDDDDDDNTITNNNDHDTTTDIISTTTTTTKPLQLAVLGRQNVGKSTLVNCLLQDQRVLTGPTPGLTRDAIAIEWVWTTTNNNENNNNNDRCDDEEEDGDNNNHQQQQQQIPVQLVDTAGIRKLTKRLDDTIEDMAVADALRAMKVAEVAVLVLDAEALYIQRQELAICNAIYEEGRAIVIAANKMDLLEMSSNYTPEDFATAVRQQIEERIPILRNIPVVPMSCKSGYGVTDLLPVVKDARDRWSKTVPTGLLNRWLKEVVQGAPLPVVGGVSAKLKYIIQTKGRPPTFIIFANVSPLPETYLRFLTKHFQDSFQFFGMPVRMIVQQSSKSNPYDNNNNNNKKGGGGGANSNNRRRRSGFGLGGKEARRRRQVKEYISKSRRKKKDDYW